VVDVEVIVSDACGQKVRQLAVGGLLPARNTCIANQFRYGLLRCVS
jgi:hypothetical protein